jgi:hypothetical protein
MKKYFIILGFFGFAVALVFPWRSFAAVMTVAPSPSNPDAIIISLNTQGKNVNAVEGHFTFNPAAFSISGVSDANSVINFWAQSPTFSNSVGTLDFAGIIPGGEITADGVLATITIIPTGVATTSSLTLVSGQTLLNDGKATPAPLSVVSRPFPLAIESAALTGQSAQAPDPFTPAVGQDASIFNGQYFVAFSTTDQGSGIDHYQVLEVPAGTKVATSSTGWQTATSPYLLTDQTLSSDIYARAVDHAGNFRTEKIPAKNKKSNAARAEDEIAIIAGVVIVLLLIVLGVVRKCRTWKRKRSARNF